MRDGRERLRIPPESEAAGALITRWRAPRRSRVIGRRSSRRRPRLLVWGIAAQSPLANCAWWEPERPAAKSLRLLPSGSDRVGDDHVRPTPARHMAGPGGVIKWLLPADATV